MSSRVVIRPVFLVLALGATAIVSGQSGQKTVRWADVLDRPDAWYATAEARRVADNVLQYQNERRTGYAWVGDWPRALLEREYPACRSSRAQP